MSDEIKKIDEISETQNAPEIKKEKKKIIPASRIAPTASPAFFAALFVNLIFL